MAKISLRARDGYQPIVFILLLSRISIDKNVGMCAGATKITAIRQGIMRPQLIPPPETFQTLQHYMLTRWLGGTQFSPHCVERRQISCTTDLRSFYSLVINPTA